MARWSLSDLSHSTLPTCACELRPSALAFAFALAEMRPLFPSSVERIGIRKGLQEGIQQTQNDRDEIIDAPQQDQRWSVDVLGDFGWIDQPWVQ